MTQRRCKNRSIHHAIYYIRQSPYFKRFMRKRTDAGRPGGQKKPRGKCHAAEASFDYSMMETTLPEPTVR
ncbi:MAG: hypothetical protein J5794_01065, partial [Lachnospiraceae bacterium]|nr:hypothetical protein [Lachnospiraceae bacterium]